MMYNDNHCYKTGCICTHTAPCEHGWIWVVYYEDKVTKHNGQTKVRSERFEGVRPCPTCDPERARIFETAKNSRELAEMLQARSKFNRVKAYEESESSKTRTL